MRSYTPDLVADLHRADLNLQTQLIELDVKYIVEHLGLGNLAKFWMSVFVIREPYTIVLEFFCRETFEHALGNDDCTIINSQDLPLDDGGNCHVQDLLH